MPVCKHVQIPNQTTVAPQHLHPRYPRLWLISNKHLECTTCVPIHLVKANLPCMSPVKLEIQGAWNAPRHVGEAAVSWRQKLLRTQDPHHWPPKPHSLGLKVSPSPGIRDKMFAAAQPTAQCQSSPCLFQQTRSFVLKQHAMVSYWQSLRIASQANCEFQKHCSGARKSSAVLHIAWWNFDESQGFDKFSVWSVALDVFVPLVGPWISVSGDA